MFRSRFRFPRFSLLLTLFVLAGASAIPFLLVTGAPASGRETPIDKKIRICRAELKDLRAVIADVDFLLKKARNGDIYIARKGFSLGNGVIDTNAAFAYLRLLYGLVNDKKAFIGAANKDLPGLNADVNDDLGEFSLDLADFFARKSRETVKALTAVRNDLLLDVRKTAARCAALSKQGNPPPPKPPPPKPPPPKPPPPPPAAGSLVLTPPIKVDPPQQREWTVDAQGGTATWTHCCDGGKWTIEYTWEVPAALSPNSSYPIKLGMKVTSYESGGPSIFSIGARAEGIQDADPNLSVSVNGALQVAKTLTLHVPASAKDAKDLYILVGFASHSITYHYHRAGA